MDELWTTDVSSLLSGVCLVEAPESEECPHFDMAFLVEGQQLAGQVTDQCRRGLARIDCVQMFLNALRDQLHPVRP